MSEGDVVYITAEEIFKYASEEFEKAIRVGDICFIEVLRIKPF